MDRAVMKTIIYADMFDYPLTAYQIQRYLIGRKGTFRQVENSLKKLVKRKKIVYKDPYYFLGSRKGLIQKRQEREKHSQHLLREAKSIGLLLKIVPWIKLIGISGSLAMSNAKKDADIDLVIITTNNRMWLTRFLVLIILELIGKRRQRFGSIKSARGKICTNIFMESDGMHQSRHDLYTAHEVLQMKILWQRDNLYQDFLSDNEWVFKLLPNWIHTEEIDPVTQTKIPKEGDRSIGDMCERFSKYLQLWVMRKPSGKERILEHALFFHPSDYLDEILTKYDKSCKKLFVKG
jgi:hypothetical protein